MVKIKLRDTRGVLVCGKCGDELRMVRPRYVNYGGVVQRTDNGAVRSCCGVYWVIDGYVN